MVTRLQRPPSLGAGDDLRVTLHGFVTPRPADPEATVANLYRQHGDRFVEEIDGRFLILIEEPGRLKVFGDRYDATSFFYFWDGTTFVWARSLSKLLAKLPAKPEFALGAVASFLSTGYSYTERTQFESIYRLMPASVLTWDGRRVSVTSDYGWRYERQPIQNLEARLDEYERRFSVAIDDYLEFARPESLGCLLSGGHDTSIVYYHAAQRHREPIHTFTVSYPDWGFDEAPKAEAITRMFGPNHRHHRIVMDPAHLDYVPDMVRAAEEPTTSATLPFNVAAREIRRHCDVILGGDAGDTVWEEYYAVAEVQKYVGRLPLAARRLLHRTAGKLAEVTDWERFWEAEQTLWCFAQKDQYNDFLGRFCTYRHFRPERLRRLLDPALPLEPFKPRHMIPYTHENFADALIEAKFYYSVSPCLIPMTERQLNHYGIRYHSPYLNRDVVDFVNAIPRDWLNGGSTFRKLINAAYKRRFHKSALLRHLPKRFVFSAQQSFDSPYHTLFWKRPEVLDRLLRRLKRRGFFVSAELDRLFEEYPRQRLKPHELFELKNHSYRIYCLLTLEVWCMEFLDGVGRHEPMPLEDYLA